MADNSPMASKTAQTNAGDSLSVTSPWLLAAMAIVVAEIGIMFLFAYLVSR